MRTVTINRIDGHPATFDPATALRVRRGVLPAMGGVPPLTEVDIAGPEPIIHTNEPMTAIVDLLDPDAALVELTAPDGSPIFVNAKKASDVQSATSEDPDGANTVLFVGSLRQAVQETPVIVSARIASAAAPIVPHYRTTS